LKPISSFPDGLLGTRSDTEQRLLEVGIICTQWSYLEYLLANAIWWLLTLDKSTSTIVTGGLDINSRISMALGLAKHLDKSQELTSLLENTKKDLSGAKKLIVRRNRAVHDIFSSRPSDSVVMIEMHREKTKRNREPYPLSELMSLRNDLTDLTKRLIVIFEKIGINVD
jgi:hypothetical protein